MWLAAAGSAAALGYALNRPLNVAGQAASPAESAFVATREAVDVAVAPKPVGTPVLQLPTVTIGGHAFAQHAALRETEGPKDISQMHCMDWQELQAGSGRVQFCE